jgi:hypothetical protein
LSGPRSSPHKFLQEEIHRPVLITSRSMEGAVPG